MNSKINVLIVSSVALAAAPFFAAQAAPTVGTAVSVSGKVLVRNEASQNVQMTFLKPGDQIQEGSIINTSSSGTVKLLMTDKTIVDLGPSSLFKVNEYKLNSGGDRKVDVSVDYGKVRTSVNQHLSGDKGKFTIRTKAATMGVRGTELVINSPVVNQGSQQATSEQTQLTVIQGKVDVANGASPNAPPTSVTAGMQFFKPVGDAPPQLAKLEPQQLQQVKQEAFNKDMTFMQAVSIDAGTAKQSAQERNAANQSQAAAKSESGDGAKEGPANADGSSGTSAGNKDAPPPPPASGGENQTLAAIATTVQVQVQAAPPPIGNANVGMGVGFSHIPQQAPQPLLGQPVQLNVVFTP